MEKQELLEKLKVLLVKECSLEYLAHELEITELEVMGLTRLLRESGENINVIKKSDGIYIENIGDVKVNVRNTYTININENTLKLLLISDTRLCSKFEQMSILNNIYKVAHEMGVKKVLHLGDLTEGIYMGNKRIYNQAVLHHNPESQVKYVHDNYPYINGMETLFITGEHDLSFLKTKDKQDIGTDIAEQREDMIYLGQRNCLIRVRNESNNRETLIDLRHPDGVIPYTVSYKPQKIVDAMREEDLPDILNFGHFLVQDTFYHHGVLVNQVPSICATTPEMIDKGYNNIIGATVLTIRFTNKGKIQSIDRMFLNYRSIIQEDFKTFKVLSEGKKLVK